MSKKSRFRGCFDKQDGKRSQAQLKSASQTLYHIHQSLPWKLSWKKSLLLRCQILGLFVNILPADGKYPVLTKEKLTIPIHMILSRKQKTFSEFFAAFLKFRLNFEYFQKKDDPNTFFNFESTDSENVVR